MMRKINNILSTVVLLLLCCFVQSCKPDDNRGGELSLSCGKELLLAEGDNEIIEVYGATHFDIVTDNDCALCVKNGNNTITVTAIKLGNCELTVARSDGSYVTCTITVGKSSAQKDFEIISTPRIENWMPYTVNTETTPGLQVTLERDVDVACRPSVGTTTYGFYYTESGAYCRLSAKGDFSQRGTLDGGMVAIYNPGRKVEYYLCEKMEIVNILNGKAWIVAVMPSHPDLRIVTEVF